MKFATSKRPNRLVGTPLAHHFSSDSQTRTACGKVRRDDPNYLYTVEEPEFSVPCNLCNYSNPSRYRG